jgi:hypothetical protein
MVLKKGIVNSWLNKRFPHSKAHAVNAQALTQPSLQHEPLCPSRTNDMTGDPDKTKDVIN